MSVEMQSCAMLDHSAKEIKIVVKVRQLDLSSPSIKHDLMPLTFLLYIVGLLSAQCPISECSIHCLSCSAIFNQRDSNAGS